MRHADLQIGGLRHSPEVHGMDLTGRALRIDSLAALAPRPVLPTPWLGRPPPAPARHALDWPYDRATSQHARLETHAKSLLFRATLALTPRYSAWA